MKRIFLLSLIAINCHAADFIIFKPSYSLGIGFDPFAEGLIYGSAKMSLFETNTAESRLNLLGFGVKKSLEAKDFVISPMSICIEKRCFSLDFGKETLGTSYNFVF